MAQQVELEILIEKEKQTVIVDTSTFPTGLANKYLCYTADNTGDCYEKEYKFVIAVFSDGCEEKECSILSLVLPPEKSQILFVPRTLVIEINSETELLKVDALNQKLVQSVFSQESFEAIELLLHQNIFSLKRILELSIHYPHVLEFVLSNQLIDFAKILFDSFENGNTLLHLCVYANKGVSIKLILDTLQETTFQSLQEVTKERIQQFVETANNSENTALQLSVLKHSQECLAHLLGAGADFGTVDINGNSIFHFAGYLDDTESIEIIFNSFQSSTDRGIILRREMSRLNKQLCPPIIVSKVGAVIDTFLNYIDLNEEFDKEGNLLVHLACKFNNTSLVEKLVRLNVDLNVVNRNALNPLKIAVIEGNIQIVKLLLGAGVSVGEKEERNPVLFLAAEKGHLSLVKILIQHGASLYHDDMNLLHACVKGGNSDLIEYLVTEQKLNINALDSHCESPLFRAVRVNCKLCVRFLLLNGADPNQLNRERESMLIHAVEQGLVAIVRLLLQHKADASYVRQDGMNVLMIACQKDRSDILSAMSHLITPETIQFRDKYGNNICHIAAMNDAKRSFALLLENLSDKLSNQQVKNILYLDINNDGLNLYQLMLRRKSNQLKEYLAYAPVEYFLDNPREIHTLYDQGYYDLLVVILDKFVDLGNTVIVHTKYFDSIEDGLYPGDKGFRYLKQSFFHKILTCPYEELKYHPVVSLLAESKYEPYRLLSYFEVLLNFFFLSVLAFALISASYTCEADLFLYNDTFSRCRLVCEIISLVFIAAFSTMVFLHFVSKWVQVYENRSEFKRDELEIVWTRDSSKFSFVRRVFTEIKLDIFGKINWVDKKTKYLFPAILSYFLGFYNSLNFAFLISVLIFIALRFAQNQTQWAFASTTFLLISLNFLEYIRVLPKLGAYIASILKIFVSDIPKFVVVVTVALLSYTGSIHLAGRYEAQLRIANNSICLNESSFIFWFNLPNTLTYSFMKPLSSGNIFLLDGGPNSVEEDLMTLNFIFVGIYLFFAFLIIIVLSNILIAQLSQTYAEISAEREFHFTLELAVHRELLSTSNILFGHYLRPRSVIDHIVVSSDKWRKYLDKSPSRNSELLVRDIDLRSRDIDKQLETVQHLVYNVNSGLNVSTDMLTNLHKNLIEKKGEHFRGKLSRNITASLEEEQVSNRLDALESKLEKIIQLLENK